jgi:hypothetical protein
LISPLAVPALWGSTAACILSIEFRLSGPVLTQVAACATSVITFPRRAPAHSRRRVIVLTGGLRGAHLADGRDRFVLGGRGRRRVAGPRQPRGATTIAEILGGSLTANAFPHPIAGPSGRGQTRTMTSALRTSASHTTRSTTSSPTARPPSSRTRPRRRRSKAPTAITPIRSPSARRSR